MRSNVVVIAMFLLLSCVYPRTVGETSHGIPVTTETVPYHTQEEISEVVEAMILATSLYVGINDPLYLEGSIRRQISYYPSRIHVEPKTFRCGKTFCSGLFDPRDNSIRFVDNPCLAYSSLAHEVAHMIQWLAGYYIDHKHDDARFWGSDGIVQEVNAALRVKRCQKIQ